MKRSNKIVQFVTLVTRYLKYVHMIIIFNIICKDAEDTKSLQ